MTTILVLTRAWPYPPGEEFVDAEAHHWAGDDRRVVVLPWRATGQPRVRTGPDSSLPGVEVDLTLATASVWLRRRALVQALWSPLLWRELPGLLRHPSRARAVEVLHATRGALLTAWLVGRWCRRQGPVDLVYSYWFDVWTLGALLAKRRGKVGAVATRVHGYDLHENRHPAKYHALKRQLAPELDALLPVSRSGGEVAVQQFGVDPARVHHSPLGTTVPEELTPASTDGVFRVLSVASVLPVKRVDRLLDALDLLATLRPDLSVQWTHLGGGPLLDDLRHRARAVAHPNLTIVLAGQVSPDEVAEHLRTQPVDVIVNTSLSEGVPVSLMEAMAWGVPALAPDVGAIHELVPPDGPGGELLPADFTAKDLANALQRWSTRGADPAEREAARRIVVEGYDADVNAGRVLALLDQLARQETP